MGGQLKQLNCGIKSAVQKNVWASSTLGFLCVYRKVFHGNLAIMGAAEVEMYKKLSTRLDFVCVS
jgi:hypothetical protein